MSIGEWQYKPHISQYKKIGKHVEWVAQDFKGPVHVKDGDKKNHQLKTNVIYPT